MSDHINELKQRISAILVLGAKTDEDVQGQFSLGNEQARMLPFIDDNMLAAFIDGTLTEQSRMVVLYRLATDDDLRRLWIKILANN